MKNRSFVYVLEVVTSLLLVGGLFYAGFFVTPVVHLKKIDTFPFDSKALLIPAADAALASRVV